MTIFSVSLSPEPFSNFCELSTICGGHNKHQERRRSTNSYTGFKNGYWKSSDQHTLTKRQEFTWRQIQKNWAFSGVQILEEHYMALIAGIAEVLPTLSTDQDQAWRVEGSEVE